MFPGCSRRCLRAGRAGPLRGDRCDAQPQTLVGFRVRRCPPVLAITWRAEMDVPKMLPENPKVQLHNELFGIFIGRKQGLVKQTRLVDSPHAV